MIHLKLTLPKAVMYCSGLVSVGRANISLRNTPCRVLVQVGKDLRSDSPFETVECEHDLKAALAMGVIPEHLLQVPDDCYIGSFVANPISFPVTSPWTLGKSSETKFRIVSPLFFDEIIPADKDCSERKAATGSHAILPFASVSGKIVVIPLDTMNFEMVDLTKQLLLPVTNALREVLFANESLVDFTRVTFIHGNQAKTFAFDVRNKLLFGPSQNGEQQTVYSKMLGKDIALPFFKFHLEERIS